MLATKAIDPRRMQVSELFEAWYHHNHTFKIKAKDLIEEVREVAYPAVRGRQFPAAYLEKLDDTRAAGFVFMYVVPPKGRWGTTLFRLEIAEPVVVKANAEAR